MLRRLIALGVGVLLIVLLLLAVKGCLNSRKERGFENYVSDLKAIVTETTQLSSDFFTRLEDPPANTDELQLEAQIASDRGSAETLLNRVDGLDTPGELQGAQSELEQSYRLRRDALAGIAQDIPTALSKDQSRSTAIDSIAEDMKALLASDVLFARAKTDIASVLSGQGVSGTVPDSMFLPEPVDRWIDKLQLSTVLTAFAGNAGAISGVHGLALLSTTIDKTPLTADADTSVSLGKGAPDVKIEVQNQGDSAESNITVSYTISGSAVPLMGEDTIGKLDSQGISTVTLPLDDTPETGLPLTLEVQVLPVLGEQDSSNNSARYTVTFN